VKVTHLPGGYDDLDDLVHHDGAGDMTVREAIALPGGYAHKPTPCPTEAK
jgi:hypothetical protein